MNSLRDNVKDAINGNLANYFRINHTEVDADLVADIADDVFAVLGISEEDQDKEEKAILIQIKEV